MKKSINLLLGLILTSIPLLSQDSLSINSSNYGKISNRLYPDNYVTIDSNFSFVLRPYDVNDDFRADLWKMYGNPPPKDLLDSLSKFSPTDYFENKIPDAYIFDLNKNGAWWDDKLLINIEKSELNEEINKLHKYFRISSRKEVEI